MDPPGDVIQRIYIFRLLLGNQIDTRMSNFYYVIFIAFFSFLFSGVAHQISALYLQVDVSAGTPTYSWFSYPAKVSLFAATGKTGEKPPPPHVPFSHSIPVGVVQSPTRGVPAGYKNKRFGTGISLFLSLEIVWLPLFGRDVSFCGWVPAAIWTRERKKKKLNGEKVSMRRRVM